MTKKIRINQRLKGCVSRTEFILFATFIQYYFPSFMTSLVLSQLPLIDDPLSYSLISNIFHTRSSPPLNLILVMPLLGFKGDKPNLLFRL